MQQDDVCRGRCKPVVGIGRNLIVSPTAVAFMLRIKPAEVTAVRLAPDKIHLIACGLQTLVQFLSVSSPLLRVHHSGRFSCRDRIAQRHDPERREAWKARGGGSSSEVWPAYADNESCYENN